MFFLSPSNLPPLFLFFSPNRPAGLIRFCSCDVFGWICPLERVLWGKKEEKKDAMSPFSNASGKKVLVLLFASVKRFGGSRIRDFLPLALNIFPFNPIILTFNLFCCWSLCSYLNTPRDSVSTVCKIKF